MLENSENANRNFTIGPDGEKVILPEESGRKTSPRQRNA